ncbi:toll-like receptor 2 [Bufo gargarizans]|uniref:toll-like receptor 2 n=1 Tax=Bufo gargarizans TaxID=30331 RepID=UPI001CF5AA0B|nr:toll-like receptor 2 [Bufo gargarizans]XP_044133763.1 toll-like receptor 2 [Bufo gargarizans]
MKTKICSTLFLILLCSQKIHKADGDCTYDRYLRHCSCSLLDLTNILTILPCVEALSFEFNGGTFINHEHFAKLDMKLVMNMIHVSLAKISFANAVLSEEFLVAFIDVIHQVPVDLLSFENTTFVGQSLNNLRGSPPNILSLQFINTSSNPLIQRDSPFERFGNWMSILRNLTVKQSQLTGGPCDIGIHFQGLTTLELSESLLSDDNMFAVFCNDAFPTLQILKLRSNNFSNYEILCQALSRYNELRHLDLSLNDLSFISNSLCEWQPSLSHLNLSNTGLEHVSINLPPNCEVLDLSHNKIEYLNISLPIVRELYLSYNRLSTLPSMGHIPILQILAVDGNPIKQLEVSQIQAFKLLSSFKGDNIPYTCSCSFIKEIKEMAKSGLTLQWWPDEYTCDSPEFVRGMVINDVNYSLFECHTQPLTIVICIVILIMCVAIIICFVKICQSNKTRSQCMQAGNSNTM